MCHSDIHVYIRIYYITYIILFIDIFIIQKMSIIFLVFHVQGRTKVYGYIMCYGLKWLGEYFRFNYTFFVVVVICLLFLLLHYILVFFDVYRQYIELSHKNGMYSFTLHVISRRNLFKLYYLSKTEIEYIKLSSYLGYDLPNIHVGFPL